VSHKKAQAEATKRHKKDKGSFGSGIAFVVFVPFCGIMGFVKIDTNLKAGIRLAFVFEGVDAI